MGSESKADADEAMHWPSLLGKLLHFGFRAKKGANQKLYIKGQPGTGKTSLDRLLNTAFGGELLELDIMSIATLQ